MIKMSINFNCGCGFTTDDEKKAREHIKSTREFRGGKVVKGGHTIDIKGQLIDEV